MKKDIYSKPGMTVVDVEVEQLIAASVEITDDKANPNIGILSNEHRGSWGDLWD